MSVNWTAEQELAIKTTDRGVIVSAAAGSGKTAVLIERLIRLLSDEKKKIPADRLLAVTFTNDAAAQMRDKLNAAFEEKIRQFPDNKWLLSQQNLLQLAKISTIDSFCLELVKENLHLFNFQGGIKILDTPFADQILEQSINTAVEELCEKEPEKYDTLYNAFSSGSFRIFDLVSRLYKFLRSLPFPNKWINQSCKIYTDPQKLEEFINMQFENAEIKLENIEKDIAGIRSVMSYTFSAGGKSYPLSDNLKTLCRIIDAQNDNYAAAKCCITDRDYDKMSECEINKVKFSARLSGLAKLPEDVQSIFTDLKEQAKDLNAKINDEFNELCEMFSLSKEKIRNNFQKVNEIFLILLQIEKRAEQLCMEAKLEKNSVDFADIELMAKDLLVEETDSGYKRTELAEEIRSSHMYEIIMIDEFQDVNNLQDLIFRAVSDSDDIEIMGKNVFVVGDIKQSIYKFRLSNPELFVKCLESAEDEKNDGLLKAIYLQKNFRSRKEVVDTVNFMFRNLMSIKAGSVTYDEKEKLELGASYTERSVPSEVMMITSHDDFDSSCGYTEENLLVAKRIKQMIEEKAPVCDKGIDRPCCPSDFCILVQVNDECRKMTKALEQVGLHAFSEDTDGYIQSREITLMLDILRIIDNPMNDIALAGVMMSPIMNFTPDDMAVIREKGGQNKDFQNHFYQILTAADRSKKDTHEKVSDYIDLGSELLQKKCEEAYRLINDLRYFAMSMSLERLIRKVFDMTDLMGITSLYLDSDKKRANLRLLLEYASRYEQSSQEGVSGFLRYIDSVSSQEDAFKQAVSVTAATDSVLVKTYHASKGLEYPFVFICQLWRTIEMKSSSIYMHNTKGFAFNFSDVPNLINRRNPYCDYLVGELSDEEKSERMRLFYVACTRAKEKLFISYAVNVPKNSTFEKSIDLQKKTAAEAENITPEVVLSQKSILSWVTLALMRYPHNEKFVQWLNVDASRIVPDKAAENVKIEFVPMELEENTESRQEVKTEFAKPDMKMVEELRKKYSFKYDMTSAMQPSKLAVTEIVQAEKEKELKDKNPEFYPNLPRLDDELDKLTNAERGTFTHKFMELANYENAEISPAEELDRLCRDGYFTDKEASGVYVKSLEKFFSSDFYKRMKNSDEIIRERKFLVSMEDLKLDGELADITGGDGMIQGIADCIFKESDGYVIVDYKTDRFENVQEMFKYDTQLKIYKAAFELILGERVKSCYIYSFYLGEGAEAALS